MIYIKIYLDQDENGEDMLVFDSVKHDDEKNRLFFHVAGEKEKTYSSGRTRTWFDYDTKVIGVEQVAISPEAKELFIEMLNDNDLCKYNMHFVDFELCGYSLGQYGWNTGIFSFTPNDIKSGDTVRTLRRGEHFTAKFGNAEDAFEYMIICDNEALKNLALDEPADETELLDRYYAEMRAKYGEPACDADTICKTPFKYLTEAQKNVIREDYRRMVNSYDSQDWHDHGDFLDDKIMGELISKYFKSGKEIDIITGRRS
jgi:hypothetical protein